MIDKLVLAKLSKSVKAFEKLAQSLNINDTTTAQRLVKSAIGTWLTNNGVNASLKWSFQESEDPTHDFDLKITLGSPAPNVPMASPFPNVAEKMKADLVQSFAQSPLLKDKTVKIDIDADFGKVASIFEVADKMAVKLAQYAAPPQSLEPNKPVLDSLVRDKDGEVILAALPLGVKEAVKVLEVGRSSDPNFEKEVRVSFNPGKASDVAFKGVENTVRKLQLSNVLKALSYAVKEVA